MLRCRNLNIGAPLEAENEIEKINMKGLGEERTL
jgi:hypothetical protein